MTDEEKKKLEEQLDFLYTESKTEGGNLDNPEELIADVSIFGVNKSDNEINYKEEMESAFYESKEVLENMASMYLDGEEKLLNNKYIKNKVLNDAQNLSDMRFLQKIAKRAIIKQMEQLEMGEATPRHYEMLSVMMREIRENIKQSTVTVTTMEGFYKEMRIDMGLNKELKLNEGENSIKTDIVTTNDLNSRLEDILKNRNKGDN